jgi:hypothetical protein
LRNKIILLLIYDSNNNEFFSTVFSNVTTSI